jgi:hypothetical protein
VRANDDEVDLLIEGGAGDRARGPTSQRQWQASVNPVQSLEPSSVATAWEVPERSRRHSWREHREQFIAPAEDLTQLREFFSRHGVNPEMEGLRRCSGLRMSGSLVAVVSRGNALALRTSDPVGARRRCGSRITPDLRRARRAFYPEAELSKPDSCGPDNVAITRNLALDSPPRLSEVKPSSAR